MRLILQNSLLFSRLLLLFVFGCPLVSQAQFTYSTNNNTITITGYTGSGGAVTIPSNISGMPVVNIGAFAFSYKKLITSVSIPDSVEKIGFQAFEGCTGLIDVIIPNSVTNLSYGAFSSCTGLTSVAIPSNVRQIDAAFTRCSNLREISVHPLNEFYSSLEGVLLNKTQTILLEYPAGKTGAYIIPDSVTRIDNNTFAFHEHLTQLTTGGLTNIPQVSFVFCAQLTNVVVGTNVSSILSTSFIDCPSLIDITVDPLNPFFSSVDGVLFNKNQDTLLKYPEGRESSHYTISESVDVINDRAFSYANFLETVTIPTNINRIGEDAFLWSGLKTVTIPNGEIESMAFAHCLNLTNAIMAGTTASVQLNAFLTCPNLVTASIGSHVTNISGSAFAECAKLGSITVAPDNAFYTSIDGVLFARTPFTIIYYPIGHEGSDYHIPEGVTKVGEHAFQYSLLSNVTLPETITIIGEGAFMWCFNLTNITIPAGVTYLERYTFAGCALTSVNLGNNVTSIGYRAFAACGSLNSVTIGSGVTNIHNYAFEDCTKLTQVFFAGNAPSLGYDVFLLSWPWWFPSLPECTIFYRPGMTGWGDTFGGLPTVLWNPQVQTHDFDFGLKPDGFGFTIEGTPNIPVRIEGSADLQSPDWISLGIVTLTNGSHYFNDPMSKENSRRFYRLRSP